jgi:hypothetical protein
MNTVAQVGEVCSWQWGRVIRIHTAWNRSPPRVNGAEAAKHTSETVSGRCHDRGMELAKRVDRRRAVLFELLASPVPLSAAEVFARISARGYQLEGSHTPKRVADILRHQTNRGRVVRVSRGRYRLAADVPRTTRRRIVEWQRLARKPVHIPPFSLRDSSIS